MEYKYSVIVDPSDYETEGLCEGIPLRMNTHSDLEDIGTIRAQQEWSRLVSKVENYRGGLGPKYNFMSVSVPECLPERLEIISYANEFAFLHDDITDNVDQEKGDIENDQTMAAFCEGAQTGSIKFPKSGKQQIQSKMLLEMLALDRERALTTMKAWAKFLEIASGRQHHTRFATLDEYIPYRIMDVGEMVWFGAVTFGMAITIPEEEMDSCRELMRYALIAAGLTNDLFSWQKEYEASRRNGQPDVVNAIWVLMREHSISVDEAKDLCRSKIKDCVAKYRVVVEDTKKRTDLSLDLRKYVEAGQYSLSGNVVWSLLCPRYHAGANYNELQLSRMKHGVGKSPLDSTLGLEVAPSPSLTNSTKMLNGINGVNGANGVYGDHDKHGTNGLATINGIDNKRKAQVDEKNGVRIVKPRLDVQINGVDHLKVDQNLPDLGDEVISAPFEYLTSLPSKGVRDQAIDAFNVWIKAPPDALNIIKTVVGRLHNASLMLDDFEDSSPLRRGRPATHTVFGAAQTINSANYWILKALDEVRSLGNSECLTIFIDEMRNVYMGQSFDLYWTYNVECPTVEEYLKMIDNKTGGTFRLLSRLTLAHSTVNPAVDLDDLPTLLGRYFQIRDDYQNLVSADVSRSHPIPMRRHGTADIFGPLSQYTKAKGFCEDLDEGKYSLPIIHSLQSSPCAMQLRSILMQRRVAEKSSFEHKQLVLDHLKRNKSLEFTASVLRSLHAEIDRRVKRVETACGMENFPMRLLLNMLSI